MLADYWKAQAVRLWDTNLHNVNSKSEESPILCSRNNTGCSENLMFILFCDLNRSQGYQTSGLLKWRGYPIAEINHDKIAAGFRLLVTVGGSLSMIREKSSLQIFTVPVNKSDYCSSPGSCCNTARSLHRSPIRFSLVFQSPNFKSAIRVIELEIALYFLSFPFL